MKGLRTMIASALVAGLMLSSVGNALAQGPTESTANIFGEVIAKDQASSSGGFVELKTKQGNVIKVKMAADTQYRSGGFADMATGKKVALVASETGGTFIAKKVVVVPSEPTYKHFVGVVTSASETTATVSVGGEQDEGDATFTIAVHPTEAVPSPTPAVEKGQYVTAVVSKDPRAMKVMAVRVTSAMSTAEVQPSEASPTATEVKPTQVKPIKEAKPTGPVKAKYSEVKPTVGPVEVSPTESTASTDAKVVCVEMSPELVREVYVATPSELTREAFIDMPPDRVMEVWKNVPPELAKEIWMCLPPELAKEIWMNLPPEIERIWIDLPSELATREIWLTTNAERLKQIWMEMPPEMAKEILRDMSPELVKEVWIHIPPEQIKQIWIHLPTKDVKQIWMELSTPTDVTEATESAESTHDAGTIRVKSITETVPVEATEDAATPLSPDEIRKLEELKNQ